MSIDLRPSIRILDQAAAALARQMDQAAALPALTAVRQATGLEQEDADTLRSHRRALEILRTHGGAGV